MTGDDRYRLGEWTVFPRQNLVSRRTESRKLEPKAMDVLRCLLERRGTVVSIEDILNEVWPGRVVEPSGIHQRVFQIRRALDDDARRPSYIQSVRKRGYRIAVPATRTIGSAPPQTTGPTRVAVRTLQDLTPEGRLSWLAIGLSEELRGQIESWPQFVVIPGVYTEEPPGTEDCDVLVYGHLEAVRGRVAVRLSVVETLRRSLIWSRRFEGYPENPHDLRTGIAEGIARFFGESMGGNPAPDRPEAFAPYLHLLNYRYFGSFDEHTYWLRQVLERDPDWHWGWGDLAIAQMRRAATLRDERALVEARKIVQETPRSEPARGILTLADFFLRAYFEGRPADAERIARKMALDGNAYAYATLLIASGLPRRAETFFRRQSERKPYRPVPWEWLAIARGNAGDWPGALDAAEHVGRLYPPDAPNPPVLLSWVVFDAAGPGDSARLLQQLRKLRGRQPSGSVQRRATDLLGYHNLAFRIAESRGDYQAAQAAADWFFEHGFGLHSGILYLRLRHARAREALAAVDARFDGFYSWVTALMVPPDLRDHPLLREAWSHLGFGAPWRERLKILADEMPASCHLD